MEAARRNHRAIVKILIENGADMELVMEVCCRKGEYNMLFNCVYWWRAEP